MKKFVLLSTLFILFLGCEKSEDESVTDVTPDVPVATKATDITCNSFTANWDKAANALSYEIDVATDSYFNMIVATGTSTSNLIGLLNLESNTRYFYRVRAVNGDKKSANSNSINTFSLPEPPVALSATNVGSSGFTVNWLWSQSITSYLLYVSTESFPHDSSKNLPNYNGIVVVSNTHNVVGLTSNTDYYYVLKATNGTNISAISNTIICTTLN